MILLIQTSKALGTEVNFTIIVSNEADGHEALTALRRITTKFEERFSRFLTSSELSDLNNHSGMPVEVSHEFRELMQSSMHYYQLTEGIFSPLVLPQLQLAGYVGSWPNIETQNAQLDYRHRSTMSSPKNIRLTQNTVEIPAVSALEFGGIGKGYLLDQLSRYLQSQDIQSYWLSLGDDIIVAGHDLENEDWHIAIARAENHEETLAMITAHKGNLCAISTSGITKRRGSGWHHLIDPRTGKPAITNIASASVRHASATAADVFAKCLVILGLEDAKLFVKKHRIPYVLVQVILADATIRVIQLGDET